MAKMLNAKQAQELVHTIEKALESLPKEVLNAAVWVGRHKSHDVRLRFERSSPHPWLVIEEDLRWLKYEAKNGRLEVT